MQISEHNETEREKESPYQFAYFVLNDVTESICMSELTDEWMLMVERGTGRRRYGCFKGQMDAQGKWFPCRGWDIKKFWLIWTGMFT
ncbi:MAG: hypothetical protein ACLU7M_01280 [Mediterraneibacter gnavus]